MEIIATAATQDGLTGTRYTMIDDGTEVAFLLAHDSGLILNVEVDEAHRGEGHARALYEHADTERGLYHVPSWGRTGDGDGFAQAIGGDVMDDEQACSILGLDLEQILGAIGAIQ